LGLVHAARRVLRISAPGSCGDDVRGWMLAPPLTMGWEICAVHPQ
jgi:hypothetical protein